MVGDGAELTLDGTTMSSPLITTSLPNGRLEFTRVITDDSFSLASFTITSASETPLVVHLSCPENGQVVFQLHNENIHAGDPDDDPEDWL